MATWNYELENPPKEIREKELWIQHAAGFIIFQDARQYAIDELDKNLSKKEKQIATEAIDQAIYGIMMIIDGVSGCLKNEKYSVLTETKIKLIENKVQETKLEIDLKNGDGMCMGFHMWKEGDFGKNRIVK